jgi:cation diffusion facilitator family transporter
MDACCESKTAELSRLRSAHKSVLQLVLGINATLFVVELAAGLLAHSTALLGDSLDMLGDSLVYGFSLYALRRSTKWKAGAAILKGAVMALFGLGVLGEAAYKVMAGVVPGAATMGIIGLLVLIGNGVCFLALYRHRSDDLNMRSTWLCSRNDIIANVAVLFAALGVWKLNASWPDLLIGLGIAILFLRTAFAILRESVTEFNRLDGSVHPAGAKTVYSEGRTQRD